MALALNTLQRFDVPLNKESKPNYIYIYIYRYEFKSWVMLFAFLIALMPLENVWIQLFPLQLWLNNRVDWAL